MAEPHRVTTADILRADLDERGIGAALVFPGRLLAAATVGNLPYVAALARAYNRYLAERWVDPNRGLYAAIMAPNQTPEVAAAEIRRNADVPGFAAVYLPLAGTYPLWGDRQYVPIFAAAVETGLAVVLQGETTVHTAFPYQFHHVPTALAKQALSQPFAALAHVTSLLTSGIFGRFPDLRVVVNSCGLTWLPLLLDRLDHFAPHLSDEPPYLTEPPSVILRRHLYVTTHPLPDAKPPSLARGLIDAVGPDHLLFGSGWPHFDADDPAEVGLLPLSIEERRGIMGGNARTIFRLAAEPATR